MCGHSRQRVLACLLSDLAWGSLSLLPIRWRNTQGSCQLRSVQYRCNDCAWLVHALFLPTCGDVVLPLRLRGLVHPPTPPYEIG